MGESLMCFGTLTSPCNMSWLKLQLRSDAPPESPCILSLALIFLTVTSPFSFPCSMTLLEHLQFFMGLKSNKTGRDARAEIDK